MNITSPVDIENTLATGLDRAGDAAETLGTAFDKLEAHAHRRAAELVGKKKSRPVSKVLLGTALITVVVLVLRRASH